MGRKKIGTQFCLTVPDDVRVMLVAAAKLASAEGSPVNEREMLSRVLLPGAVRLLSCAECRSGKCSRHVAMVPTTSDKPIETATSVPSAPVQAEASKFVLATAEPVKKPERKPRAPSVKCTYPEGFALTDDMRAYAAKHGIGADRVEKVFEDFSLHHRSKGSKFVEWTLAFYKWCRNDSEYGPRFGAPAGSPRSRSTMQTEDVNWFRDSDLAKSTGS